MAKEIKLLIRKDSVAKSGKARIEFLLYYERKQYRFSTGRSVEPRHWIVASESVAKTCGEATVINKYLSERLLSYHKYRKAMDILGEKPDLDEIRKILKGVTSAGAVSDLWRCPTISTVFEEYAGNANLRESTKLDYKCTSRIITEFCIHEYGRELTIGMVDYRFLMLFSKYLRENRRLPNSAGTVAKRLKHLKTVVRYIIRTKSSLQDPFLNFTIEGMPHKEVALNEDEYKKMIELEVPAALRKSLEPVRDIFVFCSETGLRYSDAMDLSWIHIDEDFSALEKEQVKTGRTVFVPLSRRAKDILLKYKDKSHTGNGRIFHWFSLQVINRHLKRLAVLAGINKNLTTHVARHTFGTRLGASGKVSAFHICGLMGHRDIRMSQRYINLSKDDLKKAMYNVWESSF